MRDDGGASSTALTATSAGKLPERRIQKRGELDERVVAVTLAARLPVVLRSKHRAEAPPKA